MTVRIGSRCSGCGSCVATCPTRAIFAAPGRLLVDARLCDDCLACVEVCPTDAIHASTAGLSRLGSSGFAPSK